MGCCGNQTEQHDTGDDRRGMTQDTIAVDGMTCGGCEDAVQRAIGALEGVDHVDADHGTARVTVRFDPTTVAPATIRETISGAGYRVTT